MSYSPYINHICPACHQHHPRGACTLKVAGVEHCGLCGLAHYGHSRTCPHIRSETQVREMIEALKRSPEDRELVDTAVKYLRGVKGTLVQQKKKDREKAALATGHSTSLPTQTGFSYPSNANYAQPSHIANGFASSVSSTRSANGGPGHEFRFIQMQPQTARMAHAGTALQGQETSAQQHIQGQGTFTQEQQMTRQMPSQGYDDQQVESALRGFLRNV